ncbi:MAG: aminotransferase class III-fold pyridoxal phosphate-dependent enzyme [Anaerolineae bacterium]
MSIEPRTLMSNPTLSLADLTGPAYVQAVCRARAVLENVSLDTLQAIAEERVELAPAWYRRRIDDLLLHIGRKVCDGLDRSAPGAGTAAFNEATDTRAAPLNALGVVRIGEDGRAYLIAKSEHYHAALGHGFPGYKLLDNARRLGIDNPTHNNTRGHITRLLEQELVRAANGIAPGDEIRLSEVLASTEPHVLNRIINLETGSLAAEAALKMVLARFFRLEETSPEPPYHGRVPVLLVMGDYAGGRKANYHGTTILTQTMRDMWPGLSQALEEHGTLIVRPVRINDAADFERALAEGERPPCKVAGFFHEIILMNYAAIRLDDAYLQRAYALCHEHDVPVVADEIQTGIWSPELFWFRECGLQPDLVAVGKGFPGGETAASRVLATSSLDTMHQFGALVTNGQEELASLAYLITMAYARANGSHTREVGEHYESELRGLAGRYPALISRIEGRRHLSSIIFHAVDKVVAFVASLREAGIDISAHTYKAETPPVVLTKLPLISTHATVEFLIDRMQQALTRL